MRQAKVIVIVVAVQLGIVLSMVWLFESELARARSMETATTPHLISYQGVLADSSGQPLTGIKSFTLTIFGADTGGTALWQEAYHNVTITNGSFSVLLGSSVPLSDSLFAQPDRWLELNVEGVTLTPRQRFASVPYALNADLLDGKDASELIGGSSVPGGSMMWMPANITPTGYTRKAGVPGIDMGAWNHVTDVPVSDVKCDVFTGSEVLCWSDTFGNNLAGARYNVANHTWSAMSTANAPSPRASRSAVWTGSEMIVWGGYGSSDYNDGARYNPGTDSWTPITTTGAPVPREFPGVVWAGNKMIVWSGYTSSTGGFTTTGALYDPATDRWSSMATNDAPSGREFSVAVWTGAKMIVWGGWMQGGNTNTGGIYDPATDTWTTMSLFGAPQPPRYYQLISNPVWTGSELALFDHVGGSLYFYNPATNIWRSQQTHLSSIPIWDYYDADHVPMTKAGNLIVTYDGVYDLVQDRWIAQSNEAVTARSLFWTGNKVLTFGLRGAVLDHQIDVYEPYLKD